MTREMALWVGALAVLTEDWIFVPSTHIGALIIACNPSSSIYNTLFCVPQEPTSVTHTTHTQAYKKNK